MMVGIFISSRVATGSHSLSMRPNLSSFRNPDFGIDHSVKSVNFSKAMKQSSMSRGESPAP